MSGASGDLLPTLFGLACGFFFLMIFAGIGAFLVYKFFQGKKKAEASQSWPSTPGEVIEASVQRNSSRDDEGHISYSYTPEVKYAYTVGGQSYTSRQLTFGFKRGYNRPGPAEAELQRFPMGGQVTVYYDPAKPQDAVLERSTRGSTGGLIAGIIFLVVGLCIGCPVLGMLAVNLLGS